MRLARVYNYRLVSRILSHTNEHQLYKEVNEIMTVCHSHSYILRDRVFFFIDVQFSFTHIHRHTHQINVIFFATDNLVLLDFYCILSLLCADAKQMEALN